jgi:DNA invertase Pin-like site-specific DNA recombinase
MSVDTQITALEAYCKTNNLTPYKIYNDAGISARKSYRRRPALLEMLKDCQDKKIDIVLFTRLDRFFRSVPDYYACVAQMNGVPWKAVLEDYETETPDGVFKVNIMLSVAQSEADKTSARLKDTFAYKRARGDYIGKAPTGYLVRGRDLIKDPEKQVAISVMFRTYLSTFSSKKALEAGDEYGLHMVRITFQKMLSNETYCGHAKGGYQCEPYITEEEWERIQEVKRSRTPKQIYGPRTYLFSGLCKCGYCGKRMPAKLIWRTHADGKRVFYKKYVCEDRIHPHLQLIEAHLEEYLLQNLIPMVRNLEAESKMIKKGMDESIKKKKRLESRLERLREVYIDGDLDREAYHARKKILEEEINAIHIPSSIVPDVPEEWQEIYKDLTEERKAVFWKRLIKTIEFTNESKHKPKVIFL